VTEIARFSFPTDIRFGPGARRGAGHHLREVGVTRPLIVTDRGVSALPMCDELAHDLAGSGLTPGRFDGVWGNPLRSQVLAGVGAFRAHGADAIVGFGGGAALDVAKAIALLATHPGDLFEYEDEMPGTRPIGPDVPYLVALPTTAGTGSEVGRSAVIADDDTHVKKIIFSPHLMAQVVFADPELTFELPAHITAATGMDALTHNIEAYLARAYHPMCDGIALEGLRLASEHLSQVVAVPYDIDARSAMLMASLMGAVAFQKGLGIVHSCAHALGTAADMHHGLANGVMIDVALRWNLPAAPEKFRRMARVVGLDEGDPDSFIAWLTGLKAEVGIPANLAETDVPESAIDALVSLATADACHANNPRPVAEHDFRAIFEEAFA